MSEFVPFRFEVSLYEKSRSEVLCRGCFSEVSGLELTMEPKAFAEGGRNWGEVQRAGPTRFSPIVLKRGVTEVMDMWSWFKATTKGAKYGYRLQGEIRVRGAQVNSNGEAETIMVLKLRDVMATRFKGPDLSSTAGQVAIEELTLVYEDLDIETAD